MLKSCHIRPFLAYSLNMLDEAYFMLINDLAVEFDKQMQGVQKLKIIYQISCER